MFGSQTIEVIIGLAFVYLLFSLICSTLTEFVAQLLRLRAGTLQKAIDNMLVGNARHSAPITQLDKFYKHPLIQSLTRPSLYDKFLQHKQAPLVVGVLFAAFALVSLFAPVFASQAQFVQVLAPFPVVWLILLGLGILWIVAKFFKYKLDGPGYIPSHIFAQVFVEKVQAEQVEKARAEQVEKVQADQKSQSTALAALASLQKRAQAKVLDQDDAKMAEQLYNEVEQWFDDAMERVSGWYTRKTRNIVLVFAVIVTLLLNIDTFAIAHELLQNTPLRQAVADQAALFLVQNPNPPDNTQDSNTQGGGTTDAENAGAATQSAQVGAGAPITGTQSITETLARLNALKQGIDTLGVPVGWVVDATYISATVPLTPLLALVATPIDASQPGYAAALEQARLTQRLIPQTGTDWGRKGVGLVVTMILLALGAPFWYELLGKLVNMRNAGKPPQGTEDTIAAKPQAVEVMLVQPPAQSP